MNKVIRAITNKHNFKIVIVELSEAVRQIADLQETVAPASAALAKLTVANALLGVELKNREKILSNWSTSDGMVRSIITEFTENKVRTCVKVPKFDWQMGVHREPDLMATVVGREGSLAISRDLGLKEPYFSQSNLIDGDIDMTYMQLLRDSMQISAFITTKVTFSGDFAIKKAVGLMVQMLPDHTDEDIDYLDQRLGNKAAVDHMLVNAASYEELLKEIAVDAEILETKEIVFECSCTKDKTLSAIIALGKKEIQAIVDKGEGVEVVCQFCKRKWQFSVEELSGLLSN